MRTNITNIADIDGHSPCLVIKLQLEELEELLSDSPGSSNDISHVLVIHENDLEAALNSRKVGQTGTMHCPVYRANDQVIHSARAEEEQTSEYQDTTLEVSGILAPAHPKVVIDLPENMSSVHDMGVWDMGDQDDAKKNDIDRLENMSPIPLSTIYQCDIGIGNIYPCSSDGCSCMNDEEDVVVVMDRDLLELHSSVYMSSVHTGNNEKAREKNITTGPSVDNPAVPSHPDCPTTAGPSRFSFRSMLSSLLRSQNDYILAQFDKQRAATVTDMAATDKGKKPVTAVYQRCACKEDLPCENGHVAGLSCGHEYCCDCLRELLRLSLIGETRFPPHCCDQTVPVENCERRLCYDFITDCVLRWSSKEDQTGADGNGIGSGDEEPNRPAVKTARKGCENCERMI
ncbi:hypothetical protein N0V93_010360 [Gnomoniopsis smithogilvyi]|uniref:RING-type domain-containing protein n=1 Tax=Gnomoniopsis smithogilvyi TaxID=1191159 RepID=A0A9W8YKR9_9PEZI|nr:hypothetical protein N0V93_010360 [Gnomoniopsis smithogilvyi]